MDIIQELSNLKGHIIFSYELQDQEPIVAYYLKQYICYEAQEQIKKQQYSQMQQAQIYNKLNQYSQEAEQIKQRQPNLFSDVEKNKQYMLDYALALLAKAEEKEKKNEITQETQGQFFKAAKFIAVLNVFGPISKDLKDREIYAKNSAVKIAKFLKSKPAQVQDNPNSQTGPGGFPTQNQGSQQEQKAPTQSVFKGTPLTINAKTISDNGADNRIQQFIGNRPQQPIGNQGHTSPNQVPNWQDNMAGQQQHSGVTQNSQQNCPLIKYPVPQNPSQINQQVQTLLQYTISELDFNNYKQAIENIKSVQTMVGMLEKQ